MSADYAWLNKFQSDFYTNGFEFAKYSNFEKTQNIYVILNNMTKGLPHLSMKYFDLYSPHVKTLESPAIIDALHKNFCNSSSGGRIPSYIYFKNAKAKKVTEPKPRKKKSDVVITEFESDIAFEIQSLLMMDNKTYDYLKNSEFVQKIGLELLKKNMDVKKV